MKIIKRIDHWLHVFGFMKREKSIKEKMCEAANDMKNKYKQEAREATAKLRTKHQTDIA